MGRTRKALSDQTGNLTREQQTRRSVEQELIKADNAYISQPPKWLTQRARDEYIRLFNTLSKNELLCDLDANALSAYCNAYDLYMTASEDIQERGLSVMIGDKLVPNSSVSIQLKYAKEMRDFGRQLGLTPDSRLKLASLRLNETESEISDQFGDI